MTASASKEALSGRKKAAILLVLIGDEAATGIYRTLPEAQLRAVTQEISEMEIFRQRLPRRYCRSISN